MGKKKGGNSDRIMEQIDVLDENGEKTGEVASREDVHRLGLWHKCVHIWIVNGKREVLLQKRCAQKLTNPNKWTTATSGHLSAGDSSIEGAMRELSEEIGLRIQEDELKYLFSTKESGVNNNEERQIIENEITDVYLLQKDIDIQDLNLQEEEVSEVKWFSYEEFQKMVMENDENLVPHREMQLKMLEILGI